MDSVTKVLQERLDEEYKSLKPYLNKYNCCENNIVNDSVTIKKIFNVEILEPTFEDGITPRLDKDGE